MSLIICISIKFLYAIFLIFRAKFPVFGDNSKKVFSCSIFSTVSTPMITVIIEWEHSTNIELHSLWSITWWNIIQSINIIWNKKQNAIEIQFDVNLYILFIYPRYIVLLLWRTINMNFLYFYLFLCIRFHFLYIDSIDKTWYKYK